MSVSTTEVKVKTVEELQLELAILQAKLAVKQTYEEVKKEVVKAQAQAKIETMKHVVTGLNWFVSKIAKSEEVVSVKKETTEEAIARISKDMDSMLMNK